MGVTFIMFIYKDEKVALEEINSSGSDNECECESDSELDNQIEFMFLGRGACDRHIDEDFLHTFEDDNLNYGYGSGGFTWQLSKLAIEKIMILVEKNTCYREPWDCERDCPYYAKYTEADELDLRYKNEILAYLTKAWNFVVYEHKIVVCHLSY